MQRPQGPPLLPQHPRHQPAHHQLAPGPSDHWGHPDRPWIRFLFSIWASLPCAVPGGPTGARNRAAATMAWHPAPAIKRHPNPLAAPTALVNRHARRARPRARALPRCLRRALRLRCKAAAARCGERRVAHWGAAAVHVLQLAARRTHPTSPGQAAPSALHVQGERGHAACFPTLCAVHPSAARLQRAALRSPAAPPHHPAPCVPHACPHLMLRPFACRHAVRYCGAGCGVQCLSHHLRRLGGRRGGTPGDVVRGCGVRGLRAASARRCRASTKRAGRPQYSAPRAHWRHNRLNCISAIVVSSVVGRS